MEINVKKVTMVKPAENTPRHSIWLSDVDFLNDAVHTPALYFYRRSAFTSTDEFFDPDFLKEALARVLVPFYPMAGRFRLDPEGRPEIDCNGEGVLFVEAQSSAALDDFGDFTPTAELQRLNYAVDYSVDISSIPFMVLQVTYFRCGGVSLSVAGEHRVIDGPSAFHFVMSWSDTARGLDLKIPPFFDRTILRPRDPPQPKFDHIEYQIAPNTKTTKPSKCGHESYKVKLFKLTSDQIDILRTNARQANETEKHSTFALVAGHIWKRTLEARGVSSDEETRLYFSTNGKYSRLKPPVPIGFFGNVVFPSVSIASAGEILSKPAHYAAEQVKKTLAQVDNDYLRSAIDYLKLNPGTKRYMEHNFRSPNFSITSWSRMPLYEADFGWGKPFYMGSGRVSSAEGKATVWPTAAQDGSLNLVITLQLQHMKRFESLLYVFDETKVV